MTTYKELLPLIGILSSKTIIKKKGNCCLFRTFRIPNVKLQRRYRFNISKTNNRNKRL